MSNQNIIMSFAIAILFGLLTAYNGQGGIQTITTACITGTWTILLLKEAKQQTCVH